MRPSLCHEGHVRNVAGTNDASADCSYARDMTNRTRREHTMKRLATIAAIVTAFAVAPSIAAAGNDISKQRPQVVPKATPKAVPGGQVWRAGSRLME